MTAYSFIEDALRVAVGSDVAIHQADGLSYAEFIKSVTTADDEACYVAWQGYSAPTLYTESRPFSERFYIAYRAKSSMEAKSKAIVQALHEKTYVQADNKFRQILIRSVECSKENMFLITEFSIEVQ